MNNLSDTSGEESDKVELNENSEIKAALKLLADLYKKQTGNKPKTHKFKPPNKNTKSNRRRKSRKEKIAEDQIVDAF